MPSRLFGGGGGGGGGSATTDASLLTSGTLPLARLAGITTNQLDAAAGITSGQIAALDAGKITTGILPLARLSGITQAQLSASAGIVGSQLDAAAAIASAQIAALDAAKITSGTLPLARLSGITTTQLDTAAAITSGQIASVSAATLTGSHTAPDGVLSTNVPLLNAGNTFTALQTIAASIAGPLAQINNSSTTGAGLAIGSTTVASAGAGIAAPALALTQTAPATNRYGLLSIGGAPWDGSTAGKFVGSSSGQLLALNAASGFGGYLCDMQIAGVSYLRYDTGAAGGLRVVQCTNSGVVAANLGTASGNFFGSALRAAGGGNLLLGNTGDAAAKLVNAAVALTRATKTGAFTMTSADAVILADATTAGFTVTLPAASAVQGQLVQIKKIDSSANAVTVSRAGSDTIEGATTASLGAQYNSRSLVSDGTSTWYVLAST